MINKQNQHPNYNLRRVTAGLVLFGVAVGAAQGVKAASHEINHIKVRNESAFHPEKLQPSEVVSVIVQPGQNASSISYEFAAMDSSNAKNIQVAIGNEDGNLKPGDELMIPKVFIDPEVHHPEQPAPGVGELPMDYLRHQR
jgi:hypothetical protein